MSRQRRWHTATDAARPGKRPASCLPSSGWRHGRRIWPSAYGDKRRVEISRALAADPKYLLLDEPAAGMNEAETTALLSILEELPRTSGLGLLIIDHDMTLIMRLCDRLHVLASGRTIAEGDKNSVRANPLVIEAYLGTGAEGAHA